MTAVRLRSGLNGLPVHVALLGLCLLWILPRSGCW